MNDFYTIFTDRGRAKIAAAMAAGQTLSLTELAVGSGQDEAAYAPEPTQNALKAERWRGAINRLHIDKDNPAWVIVETQIAETVGGFWIREVGIFDADGDLIAIGKFPESYKPKMQEGSAKQLYIRVILEVANTDSIELVIDPSIVLASRAYVDEAALEAIAGHEEEIDPHPNYSLKSEISAALEAVAHSIVLPTPEENLDNPSKDDFASTLAARIAYDAAMDRAPLSHVGEGDAAHQLASTTSSGFMSSADKIKIDALTGGGRKAVFTSSGSFVVPSGVTSVTLTMCGAGGAGGAGGDNSGGGAAGGGGGGGAAVSRVITGVSVTPLSTVAVTVGATSSAATSFGSSQTAVGGGGGARGYNPRNTSLGNGAGGIVGGGPGGTGINSGETVSRSVGGAGGTGGAGGSGGAGSNTGEAGLGNSTANTGAGGGGGGGGCWYSGAGGAGGSGGPGICIIEW